MIKKLDSLGFYDSLAASFLNIFDFRGRSRRSDFWQLFILFFGALFLTFLLFNEDLSHINGKAKLYCKIAPFVCAACFFPFLSITVRRLHDVGHNGFWVAPFVLFVAIPIPMLYYVFSVDADALTDDEFYKWSLVFGVAVICLAIAFIFLLIICVFCLYDSLREANEYGPSPKYQEVDDSQEEDENVTDK
jgi:uncharacterized membrane protein YhaH (DUF805 family)